ncbi:MAG: hypothetical protein ACSHX8_11330 [Opitutaceae bacterium]
MTLHQSIYKKIGRRMWLSLLPLSLALQLPAQVGSSYVGPDFSNASPIRLEIEQHGKKNIHMVLPTKEGIEIEMLQGGGAIVMGWDHMEKFQINLPITDALNRALSESDPVKQAELLRPYVEPLLPMASINPEATNIHNLINRYITANIKSEKWLQVYDMSQKMALDRAAPEIVQNYYTVAVNLFITGERDKALNLLDQLVAARPIEESRGQTMQVAQRLLDERLFEPSYRLFSHAAEGAEGLEGKHLVLRCAYLCLELNDKEGAERYLAQAQLIDEDDSESRGALQLVLGVRAFQAADPNLALEHLGLALAEVKPDSGFKQIGLYFNFLSYSNLHNEDIAQSILAEMSLLFPKGAYTVLLTGEPKASSLESSTI